MTVKPRKKQTGWGNLGAAPSSNTEPQLKQAQGLESLGFFVDSRAPSGGDPPFSSKLVRHLKGLFAKAFD